MLSWMTDKKLILIAVIVTGIEEAFLRVTLADRDKLMKKYMNEEEEEEETQKLIWLASICQSMMAEKSKISLRKMDCL